MPSTVTVGGAHKRKRSAKHRSNGKYTRQAIRTARNKANRAKARKVRVERKKAAGTWEPCGSLAK